MIYFACIVLPRSHKLPSYVRPFNQNKSSTANTKTFEFVSKKIGRFLDHFQSEISVCAKIRNPNRLKNNQNEDHSHRQIPTRAELERIRALGHLVLLFGIQSPRRNFQTIIKFLNLSSLVNHVTSSLDNLRQCSVMRHF